MGFFDKVKDFFKKLKEDNKYMARTTARINGAHLYGLVNYRTGKIDPNEDFRMMSYVNVEGNMGIIYNTGDEDYNFYPGDIVSFVCVGEGKSIPSGDQQLPALRFNVEFKDGKKTHMDINVRKVDNFKAIFQLQ